MAVSDLIAGLFPIKIIEINFDSEWLIGGDIGNALCKLSNFTINTSFAVSAYSCVAIAIDRYFAVAHPFKRPFEGKMKHVIAVVWIIAAFMNSPNLHYLVIIQYGNLLNCSVSKKDRSSLLVYFYVVTVTLTSVLPVLLILITYLLTIYKLFHHKLPELQTAQRRKREQQNKKVLKHAVTIAVLLFICHGFWVTVVLLNTQGKLDDLSSSIVSNLLEAKDFVAVLTLVYNFFIYLIFNDFYRENIQALIYKLLSI
ncbi:substance-K receptor-like [Exaiptasia diaphana]|uniref:G-protein coupled receptors family 1 profile domain-containing protein n=1 Tax=Exaiptasia diaphana TaxID=2652724 RepID=A0A913WXQ4_EXADI|nr:substance-K receptor-like [Exaiptasia diaphana]